MTICDAIVIGASAGGIRAVSAILASLPRSFDFSIFIVIHMDPRSHGLSALLSLKSNLNVRDLLDKDSIEPGGVYLAPPGYHLLIENRHTVALSVDEKVKYARPSIDVLFESASDVFGARLIGILLTGASDDGAAGIRTIKARGGLTIAQDPDTAEARTMPDSAISTASVDEVLPLSAIGPYIGAWAKHSVNVAPKQGKHHGTH